MVKRIYFSKIESTNNYAVENIENIENRTLIFADEQTRGKGRNGRYWVSEKNNLFVSLVLKPPFDFSQIYTINSLIHYTAVVLTRVFKKKYSIKTKIKWPNDLLANGKKIAGILIETVIKGDCLQGVIIGIGVNLNLEEKSLEKISQPATALNILLEKEINRDEFLDFLLKEFFLQYDELLEKGFLLIKEEYSALNMVMGKFIEVAVFNKKYYGIAKGIDDKGQLILDCKGREEIINVGDIIC